MKRPGMIRFCRLLLLVLIPLIFFSCQAPERTESESSPPNILFAIADDASWQHFGAYGCDWVRTPALDKIANEGILFTRAYTPNAKCAPSRSCILTGLNSWQLRAAANHVPFFPSMFTSYVEVLETFGYKVGYTGKGWSPGVAIDKEGKFRELTGRNYSEYKLTPPTTKIVATGGKELQKVIDITDIGGEGKLKDTRLRYKITGLTARSWEPFVRELEAQWAKESEMARVKGKRFTHAYKSSKVWAGKVGFAPLKITDQITATIAAIMFVNQAEGILKSKRKRLRNLGKKEAYSIKGEELLSQYGVTAKEGTAERTAQEKHFVEQYTEDMLARTQVFTDKSSQAPIERTVVGRALTKFQHFTMTRCNEFCRILLQ